MSLQLIPHPQCPVSHLVAPRIKFPYINISHLTELNSSQRSVLVRALHILLIWFTSRSENHLPPQTLNMDTWFIGVHVSALLLFHLYPYILLINCFVVGKLSYSTELNINAQLYSLSASYLLIACVAYLTWILGLLECMCLPCSFPSISISNTQLFWKKKYFNKL
jgi:hypothetical protein